MSFDLLKFKEWAKVFFKFLFFLIPFIFAYYVLENWLLEDFFLGLSVSVLAKIALL